MIVEEIDRHLTDAEFTRKYANIAEASPVMKGLIRRLENQCKREEDDAVSITSQEVSCPLCQCKLRTIYDSDDKTYTLEPA